MEEIQIKFQTELEAIKAAKNLSNRYILNDYYVILSNGIYHVENGCIMLRTFETLICRFKKGKLFNK